VKQVSDRFGTYTRTYAGCSEAERAKFKELVLRGGEVRPDTLQSGMEEAQQLIFCTDGQAIVGVAAVKNPRGTYRKKTAAKSKLDLSVQAYPVEFGWCFVDEKARGNGLAYLLVERAVRDLATGIFATSHAGNTGMHKALERYRFVQEGDCYPSDRRAAWIVVFRREGSRN
jgi:GNAT superfamily N-acetyltransferase